MQIQLASKWQESFNKMLWIHSDANSMYFGWDVAILVDRMAPTELLNVMLNALLAHRLFAKTHTITQKKTTASQKT